MIGIISYWHYILPMLYLMVFNGKARYTDEPVTDRNENKLLGWKENCYQLLRNIGKTPDYVLCFFQSYVDEFCFSKVGLFRSVKRNRPRAYDNLLFLKCTFFFTLKNFIVCKIYNINTSYWIIVMDTVFFYRADSYTKLIK